MLWFVEWPDRSGLDPERIYSVHGAARVSDENLAETRRRLDGAPGEAGQPPSS